MRIDDTRQPFYIGSFVSLLKTPIFIPTKNLVPVVPSITADNNNQAKELKIKKKKRFIFFKSYTAEVEYLPLVTAPVHPHLMLLPEQPDLFPLLPKDIKELQLLFQVMTILFVK